MLCFLFVLWSCRRSCMGSVSVFVMQMLYVCALCASCGSSQYCVLHDLQFVNASFELTLSGFLVFLYVV